MTLSITTLSLTLSSPEYLIFIVMLSVIMLSVIMLSVIMLNVIMLNVVMLSVVAPQMLWLHFFTSNCSFFGTNRMRWYHHPSGLRPGAATRLHHLAQSTIFISPGLDCRCLSQGILTVREGSVRSTSLP